MILKGYRVRARLIAEKTVENATLHNHELSDESLMVLQRLRDDYMSLTNRDEKKVRKGDLSNASTTSSQLAREQGLDDIANLLGVMQMAASEDKMQFKRTYKNEETDQIAGGDGEGVDDGKRWGLFRYLKRTAHLPSCVQLEDVSSGKFILAALDKIFRTYIRGSAMPGALTGGTSVALNGRSMSFRTFILNGPYISWKGFLNFLLDFNVVKVPSQKTRSGRNYHRTYLRGGSSSLSPTLRKSKRSGAGATAMNSTMQQPQGGGGAQPDPPLLMRYAAGLFLEASNSATPVLSMNKFMPLYAEAAEAMERDSWMTVFDWDNDMSGSEWGNIQAGMNFMQFMDCIGKCAVVAYSDPYFDEIVPTPGEKIEHFLSAYLGLTDTRRWKAKVDNRMKFTKAAMKGIREESAAATLQASLDERKKTGELFVNPNSPHGKAMKAKAAATAQSKQESHNLTHLDPGSSPRKRITSAMDENLLHDVEAALAEKKGGGSGHIHRTPLHHVH